MAADRSVTTAPEGFGDRQSRRGRAGIFGERGVGRDDPGMVAFKMMIESLR
jgi:hypothetical protein